MEDTKKKKDGLEEENQEVFLTEQGLGVFGMEHLTQTEIDKKDKK